MTDVEIYQPPITGTALDPGRSASLEDEIREHELVAQRNAAITIQLPAVVAKCDADLARLRCARLVPYPLLTSEEVRVWRAFLPTAYTSRPKPKTLPGQDFSGMFGGTRYLVDYAFDVPPLSVMETWDGLRRANVFDLYEVWTPERPMPEPILVGYKALDSKMIGPFLIARWGESLEDFAAIRTKVAEQAEVRAAEWRAQAATQAQMQRAGVARSVGGRIW